MKITNEMKNKARYITHRAIKAGLLVRPSTCSRCNQEAKVHAHHTNYQKPLSVWWLCPKCHGRVHQRLNSGAGVSYSGFCTTMGIPEKQFWRFVRGSERADLLTVLWIKELFSLDIRLRYPRKRRLKLGDIVDGY